MVVSVLFSFRRPIEGGTWLCFAFLVPCLQEVKKEGYRRGGNAAANEAACLPLGSWLLGMAAAGAFQTPREANSVVM